MNTNNFTPRRLPVGIQSFEKLRSEGFVYVDKTALIYKLIQAGVPCFLSRPRRFGKSLLLSTIEAYFKGKRELFRGLAMEQLEKNWYEYPVLHLSLNAEKYDSKERLADMLERQLQA
ncbi:AAA family ATPase, partial [Bacteroides intestinalis]|uniref:AAA family ATPase n=1 Tax=Bacteroides intestinalis TaxID=329854 RepID=UPI001EDBB712